jgi:hypothetical protein
MILKSKTYPLKSKSYILKAIINLWEFVKKAVCRMAGKFTCSSSNFHAQIDQIIRGWESLN